MTRDQAFPPNFLTKEDVATPVVETIRGCTIEEIPDGARTVHKPTLFFNGSGLRPLILNQFNWSVLEEAYGPDSDGWIGKKIELYVDPTVMYGGKRTGGIRVRIPSGNGHATDHPLKWLEAVELAAKHEITREQLIKGITARGFNAWVPGRDSLWLRGLIVEKSAPAERFDANAEEALA